MLTAIEILEEFALAELHRIELRVAAARRHIESTAKFLGDLDVGTARGARRLSTAYSELAEVLDHEQFTKDNLKEIRRLITREREGTL